MQTVAFHYGWLTLFIIINIAETKVLKVINKDNNNNNENNNGRASVPAAVVAAASLARKLQYSNKLCVHLKLLI